MTFKDYLITKINGHKVFTTEYFDAGYDNKRKLLSNGDSVAWKNLKEMSKQEYVRLKQKKRQIAKNEVYIMKQTIMG